MAKEELQFVIEERDKLTAQIQGLQANAVEVKLIGKDYDEKVKLVEYLFILLWINTNWCLKP